MCKKKMRIIYINIVYKNYCVHISDDYIIVIHIIIFEAIIITLQFTVLLIISELIKYLIFLLGC